MPTDKFGTEIKNGDDFVYITGAGTRAHLQKCVVLDIDPQDRPKYSAPCSIKVMVDNAKRPYFITNVNEGFVVNRVSQVALGFDF